MATKMMGMNDDDGDENMPQMSSGVNSLPRKPKGGSGIKINPANKGKFSATKKATGKSTGELLHSGNAVTRKRANFARMAKRHFQPLPK